MIKETITLRDFNDEEYTTTVHFNLSKAELIEMQTSEDGGLENKIRTMLDRKDGKTIMRTFKEILLSSYGILSADGKRFQKSEEIRRNFESSPEYDYMYTSLLQDPKKAADFINRVIPSSMAEEVKKMDVENPTSFTLSPSLEKPSSESIVEIPRHR